MCGLFIWLWIGNRTGAVVNDAPGARQGCWGCLKNSQAHSKYFNLRLSGQYCLAAHLLQGPCEYRVTYEKLAIRQGLHFDMDIEDNIDINGNEAAVRQLAAILVDNATKYCDPDGNIRISLSSQGKKNGAVLSVSNSFSAVDKLDMNAIFDRFYRASEARECANSFGLGLSIAKSIMEQHEGGLICRKHAEKEVEFVATFKK